MWDVGANGGGKYGFGSDIYGFGGHLSGFGGSSFWVLAPEHWYVCGYGIEVPVSCDTE